MRVTQGMMYNDMQFNMNRILSDYMGANEKSATQKRVNRPSDDPAGTIQILNYRADLASSEKYGDNSAAALYQLQSADAALIGVQTLISSIRELANQASTGTMTDENRYQVGIQLNEKFKELMTLVNKENLFSGHKTDGPAFVQGLGVTTLSPELDDVVFKVDGSVERTAMVRFVDGGDVGGAVDLDYEFSKDGGKTWITKTLAAGDTTLDLDGAQVDFAEGVPVAVVAYNPADDVHSTDNGTMLYIRPTAEYVGDDNDAPPEVDIYGEGNITSADASGKFSSNVQIRFDNDAQVNTDGELEYSYSSDNGLTWKTGTAETKAGSNSVRIVVPGGYVDVEAGGDGTLSEGQQLVVRPNRASDLGHEISEDEFMDVTNSGKDIFGGTYKGKRDDFAEVVSGPNIFETVSDLIAWTETNNVQGISDSLEKLTEASEYLLSKLARIGGKENRVTTNMNMLTISSDAKKSRMSGVEDVDMASLMIEITKQQTSYQSVLQSSGMIMNMSLMDYI